MSIGGVDCGGLKVGLYVEWIRDGTSIGGEEGGGFTVGRFVGEG